MIRCIITLLLQSWIHLLTEIALKGSRLLTYSGIDLSEPKKKISHSFGSMAASHVFSFLNIWGLIRTERYLEKAPWPTNLTLARSISMKLYEIVLVIHPGGWQGPPRTSLSIHRWMEWSGAEKSGSQELGQDRTSSYPTSASLDWKDLGQRLGNKKASDQNIKLIAIKKVRRFLTIVSKLEIGNKDNNLVPGRTGLSAFFSALSSPFLHAFLHITQSSVWESQTVTKSNLSWVMIHPEKGEACLKKTVTGTFIFTEAGVLCMVLHEHGWILVLWLPLG